jgi:hypothetical protein
MEEFLSTYPYLVPALFVVFWFIMMAVLAQASGWAILADIYPAHESYEGPAKRFSSISLERIKNMPATYNGVVNVGADARGLRLSLFFLFRPYHPELAAPWSEISARSKKSLLVDGVELSFARAPAVRLAMPRALAEWAAENSVGGLRLN